MSNIAEQILDAAGVATPTPAPAKGSTRKKENSIITVEASGTILTLTVLGAGKIAFDAKKASPANRAFAEMHGWKQRLSDAAALPRDKVTGKSATPEEKLAAIKARVEHYESGSTEWNMARAGGRPASVPPTPEEIASVMMEFGRAATIEAAIALLDKLAHKNGIAREGAAAMLAADAKYMAAVLANRAKAAPSSIDADDLLSEFMDDDESEDGNEDGDD